MEADPDIIYPTAFSLRSTYNVNVFPWTVFSTPLMCSLYDKKNKKK